MLRLILYISHELYNQLRYIILLINKLADMLWVQRS